MRQYYDFKDEIELITRARPKAAQEVNFDRPGNFWEPESQLSNCNPLVFKAFLLTSFEFKKSQQDWEV